GLGSRRTKPAKPSRPARPSRPHRPLSSLSSWVLSWFVLSSSVCWCYVGVVKSGAAEVGIAPVSANAAAATPAQHSLPAWWFILVLPSVPGIGLPGRTPADGIHSRCHGNGRRLRRRGPVSAPFPAFVRWLPVQDGAVQGRAACARPPPAVLPLLKRSSASEPG